MDVCDTASTSCEEHISSVVSLRYHGKQEAVLQICAILLKICVITKRKKETALVVNALKSGSGTSLVIQVVQSYG